MSIKDGGPAFPVWELNGQGQQETTGFGMTLRDYFAAKATDKDVDEHRDFRSTKYIHHIPGRTREEARYAYADAMIAAREKQVPPAASTMTLLEACKLGFVGLGPWLSAALDDESVCDEFKDQIRIWMEANSEAIKAAVGQLP